MILGDEEISFLKKRGTNMLTFWPTWELKKIKSGVSMHGMIIIYILNS